MLSPKHRADSPTTPPSSHKLFSDYPFPIINELTKEQKREREKDSKHHKSTLGSAQWHRENFQKVFGFLHHLHMYQSPSTIFADSFRQAQINNCSSKSIVNGLDKLTKPTRVKRILASSMKSSVDNESNEMNQRRTRRRPRNKLHSSISDDKG